MNLEYQDTCKIERATGTIDANGIEQFTLLYNGECLWEVEGDGQTTYDKYEFVSTPKIFSPVNDILFQVNDKVTVYAMNGRESTYTIRQYESIADDFIPELNDTCIWLKGGTDE